MQSYSPLIKNYRADVDALRAIAVLSVVGFHAFPQQVPGGFIGVDIFFVISGFLITGIILADLEANSFTFGHFYMARVRRIFPALIAVLLSCLAIGWHILFADEYQSLGRDVLAGAAFMANLNLWVEAGYFDAGSLSKPLLHLWSLGVEEQFYLIWPLILWLAFRFRWTVGAPLFLILGMSLVANIFVSYFNVTADFFSPFTRFWELMIGASLAWSSSARIIEVNKNLSTLSDGQKAAAGASEKTQQIWNTALAILSLVVITGSTLWLNAAMVFPGWRALLPVVATAGLIASGPGNPVTRALSNRLLVSIGLISYPLYLWHWPLLSFASIVVGGEPSVVLRLVTVLLSTILAIITYMLIERPVRFGARRNSASALCAGMAVIACFGAYIDFCHGVSSRQVVAENENSHFSATTNEVLLERYPTARCDFRGVSVPNDLRTVCVQYGPPTATDTVILWGDSHADAWSRDFFELARRRGNTRVLLFSEPGCPPMVDVRRSDAFPSNIYCKNLGHGQRVIDTFAKLKPIEVVLIARWSYYVVGNLNPDGTLPLTNEFMLTASADEDASPATARFAMTESLPKTVAELTAFTKVLIVKNMPVLRAPVNAARTRLSWFKPNKRVETTLAEHRALSATPDEVIDKLSSMSGVRIFDPAPEICPDICLTARSGAVLYSDNNHISLPGAFQFVDELQGLSALGGSAPQH